MPNNKYKPDYAIHPGSTLKDTLNALNMKQLELAERAGLSPKHINEVVQGISSITPMTAVKLSSVFGMSPSFWINLQQKYEETIARLNLEERLEDEVKLLKRFTCYSELSRWGYVEKALIQRERAANLLSFFGVSSLSLIEKVQAVAFRKSKHRNLNRESLAAWLRCGEIDSRKVKTSVYEKKKVMSIIGKLRDATRQKVEDFSKTLVDLCASVGIAVVFVPYFKNTHVCGAARWIGDRPVIQLSLRGSYADIFWFTFFHELGHIYRHGKKDQFVDLDGNNGKSDRGKEEEADEFARNTLISRPEYTKFVAKEDFSSAAITSFARDINIAPCIVAGRLSYEYDNWSAWSGLRPRLKFIEK